MKNIAYAMLAFVMLSLSSCKSSKKVTSKSINPIATYEMPCADMVSGDGVLRAWALGRSDNETTARKKAQVNASAELASMLKKAVESTTEDYSATFVEGLNVASKSFFNEKIKISVNKSISGAVIVCDQWHKDEQTGLFTNYIVMELSGEECLKTLYKEIGESTSVNIDKELFERLFTKHINAADKE